MHVETIMFMLHMVKNSTIWHKRSMKTSKLYSLPEVIIRNIKHFLIDVFILSYVSMENSFGSLECE